MTTLVFEELHVVDVFGAEFPPPPTVTWARGVNASWTTIVFLVRQSSPQSLLGVLLPAPPSGVRARGARVGAVGWWACVVAVVGGGALGADDAVLTSPPFSVTYDARVAPT